MKTTKECRTLDDILTHDPLGIFSGKPCKVIRLNGGSFTVDFESPDFNAYALPTEAGASVSLDRIVGYFGGQLIVKRG